jgi:hypothetical protein
MVSNVILPPVGAPGAGTAATEWVTLRGDLDARTLNLPMLTLVAPLQPAVRPLATTLRIWDVLAAWRTAERELAETRTTNPDWPRLHAELVGLRAAYHRLFHERMNSSDSGSRAVGTTLIVWR